MDVTEALFVADSAAAVERHLGELGVPTTREAEALAVLAAIARRALEVFARNEDEADDAVYILDGTAERLF